MLYIGVTGALRPAFPSGHRAVGRYAGGQERQGLQSAPDGANNDLAQFRCRPLGETHLDILQQSSRDTYHAILNKRLQYLAGPLLRISGYFQQCSTTSPGLLASSSSCSSAPLLPACTDLSASLLRTSADSVQQRLQEQTHLDCQVPRPPDGMCWPKDLNRGVAIVRACCALTPILTGGGAHASRWL